MEKQLPQCHLLFLKPESTEQLKRHLSRRKGLSETEFKIRLQTAQNELKQVSKYDHTFISKEGKLQEIATEIADKIQELQDHSD